MPPPESSELSRVRTMYKTTAPPIDMCGIVGISDTIAGRVAPQLLESMRDVMIARGPDDARDYFDGPVGMAMRRLAVIDVATGSQPFFSRGDEIVAFQNGEIYNYRALKLELDQHRY